MNSRTMTPQRKDSIRVSFSSVDATELAERLDNVLRDKQTQGIHEVGTFMAHRGTHRKQLKTPDGSQKQTPLEIENGNIPKINPQSMSQNFPEKPPAVKIKRRPSSIVIITKSGE